MPSLLKAPLLFHALLETIAALSFLFNPQVQHPSAATDLEIKLVLRSYGGLLLSTAILCAGFYLREGFDDSARIVSGAMAVYHVFPIARAWTKLRMRNVRCATFCGGPVVHLLVHLGALLGLTGAAIWGRS
ncbi:hypothetical protein DL546_009601 [Coniochaeta pulveracea]|uniref:Uncharacterized protein n=1 Tax=Coniochaeta pulveracea TaxID=177199 RepID=A0A420YMY7_9PEZI|nr:hypothetical protein DL546_009601 [Coniochaeta pulveracea]